MICIDGTDKVSKQKYEQNLIMEIMMKIAATNEGLIQKNMLDLEKNYIDFSQIFGELNCTINFKELLKFLLHCGVN